MGGSVSSSPSVINIADQTSSKSEDEIVRFIMPVFYTKIPLAPEEKEAANNSLKLIVNNRCQHFFELKVKHPEIEHKLAQEYFFDVFYNRFFDVNPGSRSLFQKPINKQGSFLLRMIALLLQELEAPDKFKKTLINLTHLHSKMGVKAVECKCRHIMCMCHHPSLYHIFQCYTIYLFAYVWQCYYVHHATA
jgi:hypothetical protein